MAWVIRVTMLEGGKCVLVGKASLACGWLGWNWGLRITRHSSSEPIQIRIRPLNTTVVLLYCLRRHLVAIEMALTLSNDEPRRFVRIGVRIRNLVAQVK